MKNLADYIRAGSVLLMIIGIFSTGELGVVGWILFFVGAFTTGLSGKIAEDINRRTKKGKK